MIYIFLAEGFEEMEALAPVDILRRAGLDVCTVGVTGKVVSGSHKIPVTADIIADEVDFANMEAVVLPGGLPGTYNLEASEVVKKSIEYCVANDKYIAAICAAPSVFGHMGILDGKKATCYPGFEKDLLGAEYTAEPVTVDGKIITGKGAGVSVEFALKLAEIFKDKETADKLFASMQCK